MAFKSAIALLFESAIFAFESAITLTAESAIALAIESAITLIVESAITLIVESAIILGESIFREWRSFFVMTKGDDFGRVNFWGIAIIFCDDEGRL